MTTAADRLSAARRHLRSAELELAAEAAQVHAEEGLALLESICEDGSGEQRRVARNLGTTYVNSLAAGIVAASRPRDVPQPTLKHLMRMSQILHRSAFAANATHDLAALTGSLADRYIDALLEGYSPAEKQQLLEKLRASLEP